MLAALAAALLLSAPAAQEPPAPVTLPVTPPREASPAEMAAEARVEAAGEGLKAMMDDVGPRAQAVREDATLSAADKDTRIRTLILPHQPVLDEFGDALAALITLRVAAEGSASADAAATGVMVRGIVVTTITNSLITGEEIGDLDLPGGDD